MGSGTASHEKEQAMLSHVIYGSGDKQLVKKNGGGGKVTRIKQWLTSLTEDSWIKKETKTKECTFFFFSLFVF